MRKARPISVKEYVENNGSVCPVCQSREIRGQGFSIDGTVASQGVSCLKCGSQWQDIYQLAGYSELEEV